MDIFYIIAFFLFGVTFGSFYNVIGLRLPKDIPFHNDRSYCPSCENTLRPTELIPIMSYVIQRGKCRYCNTRISPLYPTIEMITGLLFAFSYIKIGLQSELAISLLFVSMLVIITVSDIAYMIIPNKVLLFFLPLLVILRTIHPMDPWYNPLLGSAVCFLLIAIIIIASKGGMGAGDMKLFGVLGIILGLGKTLLTLFLASVIGLLFGLIWMARKRIKRRQPIPFGPFISIAALITYFYGEQMISYYLELF